MPLEGQSLQLQIARSTGPHHEVHGVPEAPTLPSCVATGEERPRGKRRREERSLVRSGGCKVEEQGLQLASVRRRSLAKASLALAIIGESSWLGACCVLTTWYVAAARYVSGALNRESGSAARVPAEL